MHTIDYGTQIPGLLVIEDFVTDEEEVALVTEVDSRTWCGLGVSPNPELKRRTQQYGHLFSYRYRKVLEKYGPLPAFTHTVVTRIMENKLMPKEPDHLLVNEYNAGQGIMPHTDAPALFGPAILSLSLLSACVMKFTHVEKGNSVDILLPRRSMLVMTGDARYLYKHSISKDLVESSSEGVTVHRDRRVSFTFREIIAWEVPPEDPSCGCTKSCSNK
ncbi:2og-fe oxygenase [Lichtheimia corymbifera JMRC:FSU:9682]|uniref:2og-fe oxygenase n=1 Tax=Lichtheimia corymbifera JMRC:FSU:9682 TaxID=1263082 RepID=A0A068RZX1_9FUNG|nr:2og-fe oxygenase [Lichtheimia corymbifera JMRC:FSU:9682]